MSDKQSDKETDGATSRALVRVIDQPPTVLPAVLLDDLVPFPGPVVPVLLDTQERRDAVLNAKSNSGFFVLINRRTLTKKSGIPQVVVLEDDDEDDDDDTSESDGDSRSARGRSRRGRSRHERRDSRDGRDGRDGLDSDDDADVDDAEATYLDAAQVLHAESELRQGPLQLPDLSPVGIVARLMKVVRLPDDRLSALVHLMRRAQPVEVVKREPFPVLRLLYPVELVSDEPEFQALFRQVRVNLQAFFDAHPTVSDELKSAALSIDVPGMVADFVAQHLSRDFEERLSFLAELDLAKRMRRALEVTIRELDLLTVGNRMSQEIRDKVEKHQRDFLLREQLKAIRNELGEEKDPAALAIAELQEKIDKAGLSAAARTRADEELKRLQMLPSESPEHNVVRSYIEWIASLPWSKLSADSHDLKRARAILDEDHFGLEEVKERIIEFLAVHQLNPNRVGTLMCFAGPPGVGKTSLGQSIARAMGREFYRFSVGGMRDEAEIKGHRRTYIGAMPGRILQGLRQVKTANPVFMLDELDKMGNDWRGDPSSALLEVLDPAQNKGFVDHYLDLPFDLSRVMFIATVNIQTEIPGPLRDRLEIIDLPGYIPEEKLEIGMRYLVPRQRTEHGLSRGQLQMARPALKRIISEYTHEAGVRELDRLVGKVCRKRAIAVVSGDKGPKRVGPADVPLMLGAPKVYDDRLTRRPVPGVAVGLAWTAVGGEVLFIEVVRMPGKGGMRVTGHLGEVMNESTGLAMSYVRSRAEVLGIHADVFRKYDLHLHFPAGAVKKDGPSAGVTVTTALISLLTGRSIRSRLAMTGEMTLRGEILPVGGIREKVVAARRAGVRTVIVPERNRADVEEIPQEVRAKLTFVFAANYEDVLAAAFEPGAARLDVLPSPGPRRNATGRGASSRKGRAAAKARRPNPARG